MIRRQPPQEGWCGPDQVMKMEAGGRGREVMGLGVPLGGSAPETPSKPERGMYAVLGHNLSKENSKMKISKIS